MEGPASICDLLRVVNTNSVKISFYSIMDSFPPRHLRTVCLHRQLFRIAPVMGPDSPRRYHPSILPLTLRGSVVIFQS